MSEGVSDAAIRTESEEIARAAGNMRRLLRLEIPAADELTNEMLVVWFELWLKRRWAL